MKPREATGAPPHEAHQPSREVMLVEDLRDLREGLWPS
jgi:hypothetical protein